MIYLSSVYVSVEITEYRPAHEILLLMAYAQKPNKKAHSDVSS